MQSEPSTVVGVVVVSGYLLAVITSTVIKLCTTLSYGPQWTITLLGLIEYPQQNQSSLAFGGYKLQTASS